MTDAFPVTIFHNPNCGTSRNTLALLKAAGYAPRVVDYVKEGWTATQLRALLARMGAGPRAVLRVRGTPAEELGLTKDGVSDDAIIAAMVAHPILVERPIVETPMGVVLARPVEKALAVLDRKPERFTKESGEVVEL
jgi:arsenate reductase